MGLTIEKEYELMLGQINNLISRRQSVTTTYLSVNTVISGAIAFLFKEGHLSGMPQKLVLLLLMVCGYFICGLWRRLIRQYSDLLGWWYEELRTIEQGMQESHKLYLNEFNKFYSPQNGKSLGMSDHEINLTKVFTSVYILVAVGLLASLVLAFFAPELLKKIGW